MHLRYSKIIDSFTLNLIEKYIIVWMMKKMNTQEFQFNTTLQDKLLHLCNKREYNSIIFLSLAFVVKSLLIYWFCQLFFFFTNVFLFNRNY